METKSKPNQLHQNNPRGPPVKPNPAHRNIPMKPPLPNSKPPNKIPSIPIDAKLPPSYKIHDEIQSSSNEVTPKYQHNKGAPMQQMHPNVDVCKEYISNPYMGIEDIMSQMQNQPDMPNMGDLIAQAPSNLPPPKYSKQTYIHNSGAQIVEPPVKKQIGQSINQIKAMPKPHKEKMQPESEILDRKNLRDLAYQQLGPSIPINYSNQIKENHVAQASPQHNKDIYSNKKYNPNGSNKKSDNFNSGDHTPGSENKPPQPKIEYKPYSLKDYKEIKPQKYVKLGGLGADVGGDVWKKRKEKLERMTEYAKGAKSYNSKILRTTKRTSAPPGSKIISAEMEEAIQRKLKAKEYARQIPKPKLIPKSPDVNLIPMMNEDIAEIAKTEPLTELEKLEMQHNEYLAQIERMKKQF